MIENRSTTYLEEFLFEYADKVVGDDVGILFIFFEGADDPKQPLDFGRLVRRIGHHIVDHDYHCFEVDAVFPLMASHGKSSQELQLLRELAEFFKVLRVFLACLMALWQIQVGKPAVILVSGKNVKTVHNCQLVNVVHGASRIDHTLFLL